MAGAGNGIGSPQVTKFDMHGQTNIETENTNFPQLRWHTNYDKLTSEKDGSQFSSPKKKGAPFRSIAIRIYENVMQLIQK